MSLISTLRNAASAVQVFSRAIDVEGGNVANAATPGYAAVRSSIQPLGPGGPASGPDYVLLSSAGSLRADANVQAAASQAGFAQSRASLLEPLDALFDVNGTGGLLGAFHSFSSAFADASASPNDPALRQTALSAAAGVAAEFRRITAAIDSQRAQTDSAVSGVVQDINRLASQVRDLNERQRSRTEPDPALEALRRNALDELSSRIDITVSDAGDGTLNVLAGGRQPLVLGDQAFSLSVDLTAVPSAQLRSSAGGTAGPVSGGHLGGLLDVRNTVLGELTGDQTGIGSLNELAQAFATRVNTLLTAGTNPAGGAGTPLYVLDATDARNVARTLTVYPEVGPGQLALGDPTSSNAVANALSRLFVSTSPGDGLNGSSFESAYSQVAADVGRQVAAARTESGASADALNQADAARHTLSGVSLDRSAVSITSLQRYFEAAAKLVSVLDSLTQTEINLIR